ncbi:hypothetical protein WDU94_001795 [Cyamophila willieti]
MYPYSYNVSVPLHQALVAWLVLIVIFSLGTLSLLSEAEATPQRRPNGGFSSLYRTRNRNSFNTGADVTQVLFNPPPPPPPPPFRSFRGQSEFERVPKFDVIENLELPKVDAEEDTRTEAPLKEFEYVPPSYETNKDPPYNVVLLTLPQDDALVTKDTTEEVPSIKDPRFTKFRPTRLNAFGSELIYLQSREDIERERRRELQGAK